MEVSYWKGQVSTAADALINDCLRRNYILKKDRFGNSRESINA